ncbi:hypothetical protein EVAR_81618_1 [Eumeta japonica]|uniref:Uncharacterized protein n=1 Tax=Eumeta variegata TaxID=151549 RepID=A0A4C1WCE0_EUMVA|nr:hypothetical protein EVAR_81618_1 [Eumeta japonica]
MSAAELTEDNGKRRTRTPESLNGAQLRFLRLRRDGPRIQIRPASPAKSDRSTAAINLTSRRARPWDIKITPLAPDHFRPKLDGVMT